MRINTVTIVRKKFSEVYGVFRALYGSSRLFSIDDMHADVSNGGQRGQR